MMLSVDRLGIESNDIKLQNTSRNCVEPWLIEGYFPTVVVYSYPTVSQVSTALLNLTPPF